MIQSQAQRIEAARTESQGIVPGPTESGTIGPEAIESDPLDSDDTGAEASSGCCASNAGRPTEADLAIKDRARAQLACDLLLARLYRYHPDHAMAHLKGIKPRVVDLEPPAKLGFTVVSVPEQGEWYETTAKELRGVPDISLILQK